MEKKQNRLKPKQGFTLTEVLVVVLIVAVIAAIAYPLYTRTVNKSRATEAVNLLQMVKSRQIEQFARQGEYYADFNAMTLMGQLTTNPDMTTRREVVLDDPSEMMVGNYRLTMRDGCLLATFTRNEGATDVFTFSASFANPGLGCEDHNGTICASFGGAIVGNVDDVCNCNQVACGEGYTQTDTCGCSCTLGCEREGRCFEPFVSDGSGDGRRNQANANKVDPRRCPAPLCGTMTATPSCDGGSFSTAGCTPRPTSTETKRCDQLCYGGPTSGARPKGNATRECTAIDCAGSSFQCGEWDLSKCRDCDTCPGPVTNCSAGAWNPVTCTCETGGDCNVTTERAECSEVCEKLGWKDCESCVGRATRECEEGPGCKNSGYTCKDWDTSDCKCAAPPPCPAEPCRTGQEWNYDTCQCELIETLPLSCEHAFPCPTGKIWSYTECQCVCELKGICKSGQTWNNETCQCETLGCSHPFPCPSGKIWSSTACACVCEFSMSCPSGKVWNPEACSCVCDPSIIVSCARGYTWNSTTCQCEKDSIIIIGPGVDLEL